MHHRTNIPYTGLAAAEIKGKSVKVIAGGKKASHLSNNAAEIHMIQNQELKTPEF